MKLSSTSSWLRGSTSKTVKHVVSVGKVLFINTLDNVLLMNTLTLTVLYLVDMTISLSTRSFKPLLETSKLTAFLNRTAFFRRQEFSSRNQTFTIVERCCPQVKVGNILAKAAALRINLTKDGSPIVSEHTLTLHTIKPHIWQLFGLVWFLEIGVST